ncbi:MAG: hypothetical protein QXK34_01290 [Candidatus Bathyarchaeia archaeon]
MTKKALEEEVRRRALSDIGERAKGLSEKLRGISDEEIAGLIREDRERGWSNSPMQAPS